MMQFRKNVVAVAVGGVLVAGAIGVSAAQMRSGVAAKPQARATTSVERPWTATGGEIGVRWNGDLARDLGITIVPSAARGKRAADGSDRFALKSSTSLQFRVQDGYLRGFSGGGVQVDGGYALALRDGRIALDQFRLQPRRGAKARPTQLELVDAKGNAWFYVDRLMHELFDDGAALTVSTSDIRISERLAKRLGKPFVAGWTLGEIQMELPVVARGSGGDSVSKLAPSIKWHGDVAPGGGTYQNDLFMLETSAQYVRCNGCSGENGSGRVAITPSSTLRNNVNDGTIAATVAGDPLGTSSALYTASIPWYQKFTAPSPPYGNDQHPFLIWNMYRTNADGSFEQIGRSGVKQAFLTTNVDCMDANDHNSHVLGRGCIDTYSVSNNDYTQGLSPRSEILPASGQWGRCGSTFDPDCNGVVNTGPGDNYWQRLTVGESQIAPSHNPGATYLFESWYLARQDIDIYNSMSTLTTTQQYSGGVWNIGYDNERLGAAIDRWVAPPAATVGPRKPASSLQPAEWSQELVADGGHAKVAVKVIPLGNGLWRYHYAVMNLDFAFAQTQGAEPNLRVVSQQGFDGFTIGTRVAGAQGLVFRDGDLDSGNDWQVAQGGNAVTWSMAAAPQSSLGWGVLYSFSLTSAGRPAYGVATLSADGAPVPKRYQVRTIVPVPIREGCGNRACD